MPYANPKDKLARDRRYRIEKRDQIRTTFRKWYFNNKDYEDKRYKNDPKLFIKNLYHGIWKRPGNHTLTVEHLYALYKQQRGRCVLTGLVMTHRRQPKFFDTNISMDRIDNSKGYDIGNVRLVCRRINAMRSNMTDADLHTWCQALIIGPEEAWHIPDDYSVSI